MRLNALGNLKSVHFEDRTRPIPGAPWDRAMAWGLNPQQQAAQRHWVVESDKAMQQEEWEAYQMDRLSNFLLGLQNLGQPRLLTPVRGRRK